MMRRQERSAERMRVLSELVDANADRRQQMIDEYKRRSEEAFAPQTRRNLRQMKSSFLKWLVANGYSTDLPIEPTVVADYVESLGGQLRPTTIECRLWAISEMHKAEFLSSPSHHRLVDLALKSVKRRFGTAIKQAAPLSKSDVLQTVSSLGTTRIDVRDRALLLTASDSWCHASELIALRVEHICRQNDGSSLLFIIRSKTDQYGEGAYAFLSAEGTGAVDAWIKLAKLKKSDPVFTKSQKNGTKTPLDTATISRIFKRRFGRDDVSSHSMRVGGVQDAFRLGCDLSSIMVAGRWSSPEMPARYGRRILASSSAAAQVSAAYSSREKSSSLAGPSYSFF